MNDEPLGNVRRAAGLAATGALIAASLPMLVLAVQIHDVATAPVQPRTGTLTEFVVSAGLAIQAIVFVGFFGYRIESRGWAVDRWGFLLMASNAWAGLIVAAASFVGTTPAVRDVVISTWFAILFGGLCPGVVQGVMMYVIATVARAFLPDDLPSSCDV